MVTAWPTSGMSRVRSTAGPLRVFWVAMVLFGLVYAHGASAEGVVGHLVASAAAPTAAVAPSLAHEVHEAHEEAASAHHGGGHGGASHAAEECLPGKPQQGPGLGAPCASPLEGERASATQPFGAGTRADTAWAAPALRAPTGSAVLRI